LPDVPVRVIVAVLEAALAAAVSVKFWAMPGMSIRVDGLAVTPVDKPLRETFTLPVKPFSAFAVTEIVLPAAPAVSDRFVGTTAREKSAAGGTGDTISVTVTKWFKLPDVPVKVIVAVLAASLAAAVSVKL
jgi:hypothetical protein